MVYSNVYSQMSVAMILHVLCQMSLDVLLFATKSACPFNLWFIIYIFNFHGRPECGSFHIIYFCFVWRTHCNCGAYLKSTGRSADVQIYTRTGSFKAKHLEYR